MANDLDDLESMIWGEPPTQQVLAEPGGELDLHSLYEEQTLAPEPVQLYDEPETVVTLLASLLPEVPEHRVRERLALDPVDSILGLQEMAHEISGKPRLNRSERLFYDCLKFGGVPSDHPSLVSGNNAAGSDELRWCGYVVKRPSSSADLAVLQPVMRAVRTTLSGRLLRDLRDRDQDRCAVCESGHDLQADHRLGIVKGGGDEAAQQSLDAWQLLCRVCNCEKRTACSKCPNDAPDATERQRVCMTCLWGNRAKHTHVAMQPGRMVRRFLPIAAAEVAETFLDSLV